MILQAFAAACISFYLINIIQWQYWERKGKGTEPKVVGDTVMHVDRYYRPFNRKPFNCEACLPAWIGLGLGLLNGYGWQSIEVMFLAGVAGIVVDHGIKRYF